MGRNIQTKNRSLAFADEHLKENPALVMMSQLDLNGVHTGGREGKEDNQLVIEFTAVLVNPHMPDGTSYLRNGQDYYLAMGIDYNNAAIIFAATTEVSVVLKNKVSRSKWTSNFTLKLISSQDYDKQVVPRFPSENAAVNKGDSVLFEFDFYSTSPMLDIEVIVMSKDKDSLKMRDHVHVGEIQMAFGDAFACSAPDPDKISRSYETSETGLTVANASVVLPTLISVNGLSKNIFTTCTFLENSREYVLFSSHLDRRTVNRSSNKITFKVPVHIMNIDSLKAGSKEMVSFGVKSRGDWLWHAMNEITVGEHDKNIENEANEELNAYVIRDERKNTQRVSGETVSFKIAVEFPIGYSKFVVTLRGTAGAVYYGITMRHPSKA